MEHKHAVNQKQHRHADLLRMAADNADQLFECDEWGEEWGNGHKITQVLFHPEYNWRPVKTTKKIKRWLWAKDTGYVGLFMHSDEEIKDSSKEFTTKLLWSETEFEVEES